MKHGFAVRKKDIALLLLVVGVFVLGMYAETFAMKSKRDACVRAHPLINDDMACGDPTVISKLPYVALQQKLSAYIASEQQSGKLTDGAVYFRDLDNGPAFGINDSIDYAPASLLKLPLALVYLTQAEKDPKILDQQLSVASPQWSFTEHYPPSQTIDPKQPHTIADLLERMIRYSDNDSYGVLQTNLYQSGQQDLITKTFLELGFLDPTSLTDKVLSVRQYAAILRGLYNASYLDSDLSQRALKWLEEADFDVGIKGGVPNDVLVAHKFGERSAVDNINQLHDCGIVYYPGNPYLICVMTRGKDFDDLSSVIRHISADVYAEVDARRL